MMVNNKPNIVSALQGEVIVTQLLSELYIYSCEVGWLVTLALWKIMPGRLWWVNLD